MEGKGLFWFAGGGDGSRVILMQAALSAFRLEMSRFGDAAKTKSVSKLCFGFAHGLRSMIEEKGVLGVAFYG